MGYIITGAFISLILFFILGLRYDLEKVDWSWKFGKRMIFSMLGMSVVLFGCFSSIKANQIGVTYNPFKGGIQNEVLGEGFRTKSPFDKVYKVSTEVQEFTFKDITIQTSDAQWVNTELQIQIRIDKNNAFEYFKRYGGKDLGSIQNILSNTTQKELEKVSTQYNIMQILGDKRSEIMNKASEEVKQELLKDGIIVERIVLIDADAGEAIEQAIEKEAIAKKEAEASKYLKEKAELEGEAKVTEAKKKGEALVIEAQKEKEANELKNQTLTSEILTEKAIEKWNGVLPTTTLGKDTMSIFNLNK